MDGDIRLCGGDALAPGSDATQQLGWMSVMARHSAETAAISTLLASVMLLLPGLSADAKAQDAAKPALLVCEEAQTALSLCTRPCTTWAQSQPNPSKAFDACVAKCRSEKPCVGR